ncbi:hypothetical protein B0I35DRAFT_433040 [Stachybotrys elegans]|uniref:Uncharacterized protein n=1 Tax=Stachybotrys elegans TaxID=80388 RepID=A0A8K0WPF8_9HYPO|nr:hypothetical protein B0I35DRAFT_433040 [Stachybotrys elegans]
MEGGAPWKRTGKPEAKRKIRESRKDTDREGQRSRRATKQKRKQQGALTGPISTVQDELQGTGG